MKTFPMFLQMAGRRVVIFGGGEQAAQKTRLMLKTDAQIIVYAHSLDDELRDLAVREKIIHLTGDITPDSVHDAALVFVATGCPGLDAALHAIAKQGGATVNVVDQPHLCDAITPSIVDRDPVVVAIGTEGTAPVLGRQIKTKVEELLEPRLGDLAALAGRLRSAAAARLSPRKRRDLWRWVFNGAPRRRHAQGAERDTALMIKEAIASGDFEAQSGGSVALVGAGPGAKDLITLRGVQRLQEADVIYYDRLLEPEILELARRDAERVYVGKRPGAHSWPQKQISRRLVSEAQQGRRVVRLKCGDPGVFARGTEELDALRAAKVPFEIVPGVTAACAAAAAIGTPLTERDHIDTLVLTTGHLKNGHTIPQSVKDMRPGTQIALYMGVKAAQDIANYLCDQSHAQQIEATVVSHAQRTDQQNFTCCVADLANTLQSAGIENTAIVFLRWSKDAMAIAPTMNTPKGIRHRMHMSA